MVSYLEANDGSAATADLVDHFQPRVPATQMPLFRQLLKQVRWPYQRHVALWLTSPILDQAERVFLTPSPRASKLVLLAPAGLTEASILGRTGGSIETAA